MSTPSSSSGNKISSSRPSSSSTGAASAPMTSAIAHVISPTLVIALSVSLGAVVLLASCLAWILFRRRRRRHNALRTRTLPHSLSDSPCPGLSLKSDDHHESSSSSEAVGDALSPTATSRSPEGRSFAPLPSNAGTALLESPTIQSADTASSPILARSLNIGQLEHAGLNVITAGASRCSVRPLPDPLTSASPANPELTRREMGDYEKPSAPLPDGADNRGDMSTQYAVQQEAPFSVQEGSQGRRRLRVEPILIEEDFTDDEQPPPYEPRA
ncbi:hypothetical protein PYCCODRAFT_1201707 [Trametes coccinea BRFM310]|uniref:Uncharacterized protein n=1 Tax=Trametes coccinea (strain BRFM310) TaxID=1353009 RepID=A0A1Y2I7A7_TRAC3|nr:hypothetical protein PYCCODRAFT_1201707 [Trametes coccinea BRFM310]